jgi:hypothetical protein
MKAKLQIKTRLGSILFEFEKEDNTIKDTVIEAVKSDADLQGADLRGADLRGANLQGAYLQGAYLQGAYLQGAYLLGADLQGADLQDTDLQDANLRGADLRGANLRGANLQDTDLQDANLRGADLRDAKSKSKELADLKKFFWIIPEEGSFIAWKKCRNAVLKIEIPANAKRTSNILNRKCRAEFINVLSIEDMECNSLDIAIGMYDNTFIYKLGEVRPDKYDDDYLNDCSHGIHFFVTKQEAIEWDC